MKRSRLTEETEGNIRKRNSLEEILLEGLQESLGGSRPLPLQGSEGTSDNLPLFVPTEGECPRPLPLQSREKFHGRSHLVLTQIFWVQLVEPILDRLCEKVLNRFGGLKSFQQTLLYVERSLGTEGQGDGVCGACVNL